MRINRNVKIFIIFLLLGVGGYFYLMQDFKRPSPTLYLNGNFITVNPNQPKAEAMYVADGKIVAIGKQAELEQQYPKIQDKVDLRGATVLPGFIDPHTHFAISLFMSQMHDVSGFTHSSNREVSAALAKAVSQTPKGEWILGKGIDPVLTRDLIPPTLAYLDSIAPENPVLLFSQSLHSYWANSLAFKAVGINNQTPNPSQSSYYAKDRYGNLNGTIVEQLAIQPFLQHIKINVITPELLTQAAPTVMADYAKNGNTTLVSAGITIQDSKPLMLFEHLSAYTPTMLGKLLELIGLLPERKPYPRHFIYMRHDMAHLLPEHKEKSYDFYDILGVKHWYDGSPYTGSMYLNDPYLDNRFTREVLEIHQNHTGTPLIKPNELRDFIQNYHKRGWQIAFHVQGDAATQEVLDTFSELDSDLDFSQSRHRLEHNLLLSPESVPEIKRLGLTPSFHINHILYYGDTLYDSILGPERAQALLPVRSFVDADIPVSFHADQPMFESHPFSLIETAVTRKTSSGRLLGESEKITVMQGIKAMTLDAAWQIHKEDKLGSLEPGKYADFIVLDKDPLQIIPEELHTLQILKTYVNGNEISFR